MLIRVVCPMMLCAILVVGSSTHSSADSREDFAFHRLLEQYNSGREEYLILTDYFNEIATIRVRSSIKRTYIRHEKHEKCNAPSYKMEGVSTFKERRAYDYGRRHRNNSRVR